MQFMLNTGVDTQDMSHECLQASREIWHAACMYILFFWKGIGLRYQTGDKHPAFKSPVNNGLA